MLLRPTLAHTACKFHSPTRFLGPAPNTTLGLTSRYCSWSYLLDTPAILFICSFLITYHFLDFLHDSRFISVSFYISLPFTCFHTELHFTHIFLNFLFYWNSGHVSDWNIRYLFLHRFQFSTNIYTWNFLWALLHSFCSTVYYKFVLTTKCLLHFCTTHYHLL